MEKILQAIDTALEEKGLSDAAASRLASGNPSVIKNLRRERGNQRSHPIDNLLRVLDVLGLEFHVAPRGRRPMGFSEVDNSSFFEASPGFELPTWLAVPYLEETGQGDSLAPYAVSKHWVEEEGLVADQLAAFRIRGPSGVEGIQLDDVVLLDTRPTNQFNGEAYVFFTSLMGGAYCEHLRQFSDGRVLGRTSDHGGIEIVEPDQSFKLLGKVVALFRANQYEGRDDVS